MISNWPFELKNQEFSYDRNKMRHSNLLSDQDVWWPGCSLAEKVRVCSKNVCKFC